MAPAFGMEVTTEVLRCLKRDKLNDALWIVKEKEASLFDEKERLEKLIQDMQQYASGNQAPGEEEWFNINEASKRTRVPKSAIRYWEKVGLLMAGRDPANDYRRYSASHLLKIRLLQVLRSSVYSEDVVNLKKSIAAVQQTNLQHVMIAANSLNYLNKINESQVRGIYYLYKLIRLTKAAYLYERKPWEDKLSP